MIVCKQECKSEKGHTCFQWLIAFMANLSLLTYGLQVGWLSPMTVILQSVDSPTGRPLSASEVSWIGSTMALSATVGVPLYSYMADVYGRKSAVLALSLPQALCWLLKLSSANTTVIIISRIFCGLAAGGCFVVVPMYVKEISQDNIRGVLGSLSVMLQNLGILIMYLLGAYLGYFKSLYSVIWIPFATFLLMLKAPESPAYLMKTEKVDEATSTVAMLRALKEDDAGVLKEIESMRKEDLHFKSLPSVSFISILRNNVWRRSFVIIVALMTMHACNGSFTIVVYATTILTNSGSSVSPELQSISFPLLSILATSISMNCVERFGRKPVLGVCFTLIAVAMTCIGTVVLIQDRGGTVSYLIPLISMIVAVAAYAAGPSPIPFIVLSEIFNFQIRAKLMGCIVSYTWFMNFVPLFGFAPIANTFGLHTAFYIFAVINLLGTLISVVFLPETKGNRVRASDIFSTSSP